MSQLTKRRAKTKDELMRMYLPQLPVREIRTSINEIIRELRPNASKRCRIITKKEYEEFVSVYGEP